MDNFDKRQAVVAELLRDAGRSDRLIAERLDGVVSSGLVRKVRLKLEQEGKLEPGKRVGRDGRRRGQPRPSARTLLRPQPSTPGVTYAVIDEDGHQQVIEIHPSEADLPPDAPPHQEPPATAQPEGKSTRSKATSHRKKT